MPPPAPHPAPSPGRGTVSPGAGANMWGEMPTPPTSGVMCGIGCNINVNPEVVPAARARRCAWRWVLWRLRPRARLQRCAVV